MPLFLIVQLEALHALEASSECVPLQMLTSTPVHCAANIPIASESNILATGAGYGIDGYGVGKFGGVEVLVTERDGTVRKFLGDVPWAIAGWFQFLAAQGAAVPPDEYRVCGLCVKPADTAAITIASQP
jgi:hypothetical protein